MSFHRTIAVPGWPKPSGYSDGVLAPAGARLLSIAGQVAWNERHEIVSPDFAAQFGQALRNVCAVVAAAGGGPEHLTRLVFYVVDADVYRRSLAAVGAQYRAVVGRHFPACTLVQVAALLEAGALVEIEATAALPAA
jgi:enamine deaminase RidA (YjgF/YER057c/UK114 family)